MDAIRPSSRLVPRKHCSAQGLGAFGSAGAGRGLATPLTRIWQKPHEPLPNANPTPFSRPEALASPMSPLDQHFLKQIAAGRGRGIRPPFPGGPPRIGAIGGIGAGPNDTAVFGFPFLSTVGGPISRYVHRHIDRCDCCRIRWLCSCTAVELDCTGAETVQPHSQWLRTPLPASPPPVRPLPLRHGRLDTPARQDQKVDGLSFIEKWRVSYTVSAAHVLLSRPAAADRRLRSAHSAEAFPFRRLLVHSLVVRSRDRRRTARRRRRKRRKRQRRQRTRG